MRAEFYMEVAFPPDWVCGWPDLEDDMERVANRLQGIDAQGVRSVVEAEVEAQCCMD